MENGMKNSYEVFMFADKASVEFNMPLLYSLVYSKSDVYSLYMLYTDYVNKEYKNGVIIVKDQNNNIVDVESEAEFEEFVSITSDDHCDEHLKGD